MKRSVVNSAIDWAIALLEKENCKLPDYAYWTLEDWKNSKDKSDTNSEGNDRLGCYRLWFGHI